MGVQETRSDNNISTKGAGSTPWYFNVLLIYSFEHYQSRVEAHLSPEQFRSR